MDPGSPMDTEPGVGAIMAPCIATPPPRHSTRQQPWYVYPMNDTGVYNICGDGPRVLCGYLFNAEAERQALGQHVGEGEECCIALEPIADACLPFAPGLRVQQLYPEFTGVELRCGHRLSAACLLWHWCLSPMVCPICRAKYTLGDEEPVPCSPGNFPLHACNKLSHRIDDINKADDNEQQLASAEYIMEGLFQEAMENVVQHTMQSVVGNPRSFHVILSLQNDVSSDVVRCLQLYRCPDIPMGLVGRMRFNAQYSHLRRFNSVSATEPTEDRDAPTSYGLKASLVIQDPLNQDRMVEVSRLALVNIEHGVPVHHACTTCTDIQGHMNVECCQHNSTANIPRILSLSFNVDTASLLDAVARLFTYEITYADPEHDSATTITIGPSNER